MRLKSFYGKSLNEAMKEVRTLLGDEAIIVAIRDDEAGGVRVTAATDDAAPSAEQPAAADTAAVTADTARAPGSGHGVDQDLLDRVTALLSKIGVPANLANKLLGIIGNFDTSDALLSLGAAFDTAFSFDPVGVSEHPRPLAIIGPPGAGKSVMVAKLAARARLAGKSVGLISADTVKAGGVEQLQAFARILKTPMLEVEDGPALREALGVQAKHDMTLIDMAGCNPFLPSDLDDLHKMLESIDCEPVLVLPGGIDITDGLDMAQRFRALGVQRLLLSRLDTTKRLGVLLGIADDMRLYLSEASHSPHIADGLTSLNPVTLARFCMPDASAEDTPRQAGEKQTGQQQAGETEARRETPAKKSKTA